VVVPTSRIGVHRDGSGAAVIALDGEHDLNNAPRLRAEVDRLLSERAPVVIDLERATFIDSSILAVLLASQRSATEKGVGFAVAIPEAPDAAVRRVIDVTRLEEAVAVTVGREAAVERAESGAQA
jgi:anti-anti-sigma factor